VGVFGRYARAIIGPTAAAADLESRDDVDLQLSAELPLQLGPVRIAPTLGVGGALTHGSWRLTNDDGSATSFGRRHRHHIDHQDRNSAHANDPTTAGENPAHPHHSGVTAGGPTAAMTLAMDGAAQTISAQQRRLLAEAGLHAVLPIGAGFGLDVGVSVGSALYQWGDGEAPQTQLHGGFGLRYGAP
jgi:hypothetical protein